MYENLIFQTHRVPGVFTPEMIQKIYSSREDILVNGTLWNAQARKSLLDIYTKSNLDDFRSSGSVKTFRVPPVSPYAREHLTWLKSFEIFIPAEGFLESCRFRRQRMLCYTYEGHALLEYEGKQYRLEPGDVYFIDGRLPYRAESRGNIWTHGILDLEGPHINDLYEIFAENHNPVFSDREDHVFLNLLDKILQTLSVSIPYRDWQVSAYLDEMLAHLLVSSYSSPKFSGDMRYVVRYMESNYTKDLTLDYLARFCGISKSHLSREFKKYTGFSPMNYIIQLRLSDAEKKLASTSDSIAVIAEAAGFHNVNNFINLFKKKIT